MSKYMLYNGIKLPALPESLLAKYPYVLIIYDTSKDAKDYIAYDAYFSTVPAERYYSYKLGDFLMDTDELGFPGTSYFCPYLRTGWDEEGVERIPDSAIAFPGYSSTVSLEGNNSVIWTNHDIYDTEGVLQFPKSDDPVPVKFDLKDFLIGFALGLAGKQIPSSQKPISYSYNGVILPKLPEWDREMYPYAYIWAAGWQQPNDYITMYKLTVINSPIRYGTVNGTLSAYIENGAETAMYNCPKTDGEYNTWEYHSETVSSEAVKVYPFWTNHDVISDTDGTVYMAGSDPIPVYE